MVVVITDAVCLTVVGQVCRKCRHRASRLCNHSSSDGDHACIDLTNAGFAGLEQSSCAKNVHRP